MKQPTVSIWYFLAAALLPPLLLVVALPPLNLWPLAFVALVPLFYLVRRPDIGWGRLSCVSIAAGGLYWAASNHWILVSAPYSWLHLSPAVGWSAGLALIIILALGAGLGWAVYVWLARRIFQRFSLVPAVVLAASAWAALEVIRSVLYWHLSFGLALGYSLPAASWFGQTASLGGVWLVGLGIVAVNWLVTEGLLASPTRRPALIGWLAGVLIIWAAVGGGLSAWLRAKTDSQTIEAVAVQTHRQSPIDLGDPARYDKLLVSAQATAPLAAQRLIVLPEDAFAIDSQGQQRQSQRPLQIVYPSLGALVTASFQRLAPGATLVAGFADTSDPQAWHNGAIVLDRRNYDGAAYKRDLMPFGEYLPLARAWPASLQSQFPVQSSLRPALVTSSVGTISQIFCNELLQPDLAQSDVHQGAAVIAGLASDYDVASSWVAAWQIRAASYRAIETWRPLVLAADQTQSAIIAAGGRVVERGVYDSDEFIKSPIHLVSQTSLWVRWQPFWRLIAPLSFLWLVLLLIITSQTTRQGQVGRG